MAIPMSVFNYFLPQDPYATELPFSLGTFFLFFIAILVVTSIGIIGIAFITQKYLNAKESTFEEIFNISIKKFPGYIGTQFLFGIIILGISFAFIFVMSMFIASSGSFNIGIGNILFIIVFLLVCIAIIFYLSINWIFSGYTAIFKKKYFFNAFEYSKKIVDGRWWIVFGYMILFGILTFIASLIFELIAGFAQGAFSFMGGNMDFTFYVLISAFLNGLLGYYYVIYTIFFLGFDHERKEIPSQE